MIRINRPGHNGKYNNKTGTYFPLNKSKYVGKYNPIFKSLLEYRCMRFLDQSPAVISWNYEPTPIHYIDKSSSPTKSRKYYIDFMAKIRVNEHKTKTVWIEVKSYKETVAPKNPDNLRDNLLWLKNQSKWKQATITAKEHGCEFLILTEKQLT